MVTQQGDSRPLLLVAPGASAKELRACRRYEDRAIYISVAALIATICVAATVSLTVVDGLERYIRIFEIALATAAALGALLVVIRFVLAPWVVTGRLIAARAAVILPAGAVADTARELLAKIEAHVPEDQRRVVLEQVYGPLQQAAHFARRAAKYAVSAPGYNPVRYWEETRSSTVLLGAAKERVADYAEGSEV